MCNVSKSFVKSKDDIWEVDCSQPIFFWEIPEKIPLEDENYAEFCCFRVSSPPPLPPPPMDIRFLNISLSDPGEREGEVESK